MKATEKLEMNHNMEALREKGVAEKMIISNDYVSARDKLLKAQQLCPALDHISPMLTVCDILSAAGNKFPGYGIDYYWVLQLMPSCTFSDVRCRYQKLVTLLQPIKNKFPGTELALKLIRDAFSVLSDRDKRCAFDMNRGASWAGYGSVNVRASLCHNISTKDPVIAAKSSFGCDQNSSSQTLDGSKGVGFATEMLSERVRGLGPNLLANHNINKRHDKISLQEPGWFSSNVNSKVNMGADVDMPADNIISPTELHPASLEGNPSWFSKVVGQKRLDQDFYDFEKNRKVEFFETGQIWAAQYQSTEPQNRRYARINTNLNSAVSVTWLKPVPVSAGERKWCDAGLPVACGSFCLDLEMTEKLSQPMVFSYNCSWVRGVTEEQFEIYPKKGEVWALYKDWNLDECAYDHETVKECKFILVEILSDFSKYLGANGACLVKVDGFRSIFQRQTKEGNPVIFHTPPNNLYTFSHNVPEYRFTGGEIDGVVDGMFELDQLALPDNMIQDMDSQTAPKEGNSSSSISTCPVERLPSLKSYSDSKFLKPNWSPNDFAIGQIWAVYWRKDFLPRRYTRINNVVSESQVCVTFLEPQPIFDYEINWKKENLPIVCGIFKVGGTNVNLDISQFSHSVRCQRSTTKPFYKIYPMKGEIWAMYKNWNSKWKYFDYESYQCRVVEILSDFSEGNGITITRLGEVKGCLTFFHRQQYDGFDLTRAVSKSEMLSFSHQIPAFRVPGIGSYGIPESSWHLEPNALPPRHQN